MNKLLSIDVLFETRKEMPGAGTNYRELYYIMINILALHTSIIINWIIFNRKFLQFYMSFFSSFVYTDNQTINQISIQQYLYSIRIEIEISIYVQ